MKIIDLKKEHEPTYFNCLEDWSSEIKEGHPHKENWYNIEKDRGLRVKLAKSEDGKLIGMIQYVPVEHSFVNGRNLYVMLCIWVHGHKEGVGNQMGKGTGKALLSAAEEDVKSLGAKGLAVWGLSIPAFMRASWFKKQGYKKTDKMGIQVLLWKPFASEAEKPSWVRPKKKPGKVKGTVDITIFQNGWCSVQNMAANRIKRAAAEFGDIVKITEYNTSDRETFLEWGISGGIFINGKELRTGPPPSYEKLKKIVGKYVRKI
jgi:N-acetylglutamate synthase-like GNAT family acetyltransferase